jgi:predicted DNA-binding transcriptional regulator YafY
MNRTDRLYALVEELRAAGPAGRTAARLAARFEVAERTIKRDIGALQQSGVPIWATSGPGGGYALDAAATLPPLTFTTGEATAVAIALASQPGLPFGPDGRSALTKLVAAMTPSGRVSASALASRIWLRYRDDDARNTVTRALEQTLEQQHVVVLDYVDRDGRHTEKRPVEPMMFARDGDHWYLLAWCRRRRAGRWFRLDRITGAWPTHEPFTARDVREVFGEPPPDSAPVSL